MGLPDTPSPPGPTDPEGMDAVRPATTGVGRAWAVALAAAVSAAVLGWGAGESGALEVGAAIDRYSVMGQSIQGVTPETRRTAEVRTAALVYGAFGLLLGLGLGLAGRRATSRPGSAARLAAGGCAAAAAGAVPSLVVLPAYFRWAGDRVGDLLPTLAMHALIWAPLGAAAGLSYALGRCGGGRTAPTAAGGLVGAVVGTAAYELLGALVLSLSGTVNPIAATSPARLLTFFLLAVPIAAGAVLGGQDAPPSFAGSAGRPAANRR